MKAIMSYSYNEARWVMKKFEMMSKKSDYTYKGDSLVKKLQCNANKSTEVAVFKNTYVFLHS